MKKITLSVVLLLVGISPYYEAFASNNLPSSGVLPDVVFVRKDCTAIINCATTIDEMVEWTWTVRNPTINSRLLIDIGPGDFNLVDKKFCSTTSATLLRGYLTVRGSGRGNTIISATRHTSPVMLIENCYEINFQDLTVRAGASTWGVEWNAGGNSKWSNVEIEAPGFAWYDSQGGAACAPGVGARHEWFSSTIRVVSGTPSATAAQGIPAYYSACGDAWFWGSEIINNGDYTGFGGRSGIRVLGAGAQVHLYGSNVRVSSSVVSFAPMKGLRADGGTIHFHGGEVAVRSEGSGNQSVVGASASGAGALVNAHEISWGLKSQGTGSKTRLSVANGGQAQTSFGWTPGVEPPQVTSLTGSDTFIETDCSATGCQSAGTETHLLIYNSACGSPTWGPWFDVVTGRCRGL